MDKRVIVHTGAAKTGSKALQYALASAHDALRRHGMLYSSFCADPEWGNGSHIQKSGFVAPHPSHRSLFIALMHQSPIPMLDRQAVLNWWELEFKNFARSDAHTLLLSYETIFHGLHAIDLTWLLERLSAFKVELVVVLRPAHIWLNSLFVQEVKMNGLAVKPASWGAVRHYFAAGYLGMLQDLRIAWKNAPVSVIDYDQGISKEHYAEQFLNFFGISTSGLTRTKIKNVSLGSDLTCLLWICNRRGGFERTELLKAIEQGNISATGPARSMLPENLQKNLIEKYVSEIDLIAEKFPALGTWNPRTKFEPMKQARFTSRSRQRALESLHQHVPDSLLDELRRKSKFPLLRRCL